MIWGGLGQKRGGESEKETQHVSFLFVQGNLELSVETELSVVTFLFCTPPRTDVGHCPSAAQGPHVCLCQSNFIPKASKHTHYPRDAISQVRETEAGSVMDLSSPDKHFLSSVVCLNK